jgi:hypothetical protein
LFGAWLISSFILNFLLNNLLGFIFNYQGSEKLFQLVSDGGKASNTYTGKKETEHDDSKNESLISHKPNWVSIHILF